MNTKIRELKYKDRRKLSAMLKNLSVKLNDDTILKQFTSEPTKLKKDTSPDDSAIVQVGMNIFNQLIQFLEDEITEWFADLIGVDLETYLEAAPFDIEIIIIDQLMSDKGQFKSFLAGASKLYKSIKESINNFKTQKDK